MKDISKYEEEILASFKKGSLKRIDNLQDNIDSLKKVVKKTKNKSKSISLRISEKDLSTLKSKAFKAGIPYQTLIGTLIKQYNEGRIKLTV